MSRLGSNYDAYARVPICRACGNPFVPPGYDGCCSLRCVQYLEVACEPKLGDPIFCQRDEPIKCWGCEVSFMSRGIRYCPECYFKARPDPNFSRMRNSTGQDPEALPAVSSAHDTPQSPKSADLCTFEPTIDRTRWSLCRWRRLDDSEA